MHAVYRGDAENAMSKPRRKFIRPGGQRGAGAVESGNKSLNNLLPSKMNANLFAR